jgi:hypothetical protein
MFGNIDKPDEEETLLVDGDLVAYQAAAASDGRMYAVHAASKTNGGMVIGEFKYKKEAKEFCDEEGIDYSEIELKYSPEPFTHCLHNIKLNMQQIIREASSVADPKVVVYLTGKTNFRNGIHPDYKANRKDMRRPEHLKAAREYLREQFDAITLEGYEADDLIGMKATELGGEGKGYVICTLDKDLNTIEGKHYNWRSGKVVDIGEMEALRCLYEQAMMGDKTDNISGLPGVGPKTAAKQIAECKTEEEMYYKSLELYFKKIPQEDGELVEDWCDRVEALFFQTCSLVFIMKEEGTLWKPPASTWSPEEDMNG